MWTESAMSFGDSLMVSLFGLGTVFLTLVVLMAAILVISWLIRRVPEAGKKERPSVQMEEKKDGGLWEAKRMAALMAALSEESGIPPQQLRILSIRELEGHQEEKKP